MRRSADTYTRTSRYLLARRAKQNSSVSVPSSAWYRLTQMDCKLSCTSLRNRRFLSTADPERSNQLGQKILVFIDCFSPCPSMSCRGSNVRQVWRIFVFVIVVSDEMCCFTARLFDLAKHRATMSQSRTFAERQFVVLRNLTKNKPSPRKSLFSLKSS